jgi:hypothetical protein
VFNALDNEDDGDGVLYVNDAFDFIASESVDTDVGGMGDNLDWNDDDDTC